MRRNSFLAALTLLLLGCSAPPGPRRYQNQSQGYHGQDLTGPRQIPVTSGRGITDPKDPRFPKAVFELIRQRWNKSATFETKNGEFVQGWVTAWHASGSERAGYVAVWNIMLETVNSQGAKHVIRNQTYKMGDEVWGGWWRYDDEKWFGLGKTHGQDTFQVRKIYQELHPAVVMDTARFAHEPSAGHIWTKDWPRAKIPDDALEFRLRVVAQAFGDAMFHVGLDQYKSADSTNESPFEPMGSDTYAAEHGMVDITLTIRVTRN